jgi:hypothetical protein
MRIEKMKLENKLGRIEQNKARTQPRRQAGHQAANNEATRRIRSR